MDLFSDTYHTIMAPAEGFFKDRGSKFPAFALPVRSEEEVKKQLTALKAKYYDARHHCYAYALGPTRSAYRVNDDGEPSGTAGKPIYGQLLSFDLTDVLVVVVRYFGGTKLGIPGLINAYRSAARDALLHADIIEKMVKDILVVRYDYPMMDVAMRYFKEHRLDIMETRFELSCEVRLGVRRSLSDKVFNDLSAIHGLEVERQ